MRCASAAIVGGYTTTKRAAVRASRARARRNLLEMRTLRTARVHLPSLFRRTKRTHHRCRTTTCTRRGYRRARARLHVPGPVGVHRARGAAKFCALGVGDPTSTSPLVPLGTTHCSSSRGLSARARDLALGSWVDSGFGRLVRVLMRVGVDENPPLTDVNGVLSPG